jgi:hypothetical protein
MLEGDWNVFAGQYFDVFDYGRHTARPEEIRLEHWWPRWISIDWGFQHNSAVYWHCAVPASAFYGCHLERSEGSQPYNSLRSFGPPRGAPQDDSASAVRTRIVTYREFVQSGLSPRMLAQAIAERSGRERISEVFLSPDAFAHRTSEASIAEQLGDILVANGLPRPALADDDRVGGWQWMYQLLQTDSWLMTDNCTKLIDCLPNLIHENGRNEDVRKVDGDDPADAARYGLVSGARLAGMSSYKTVIPSEARNLSSLDTGPPNFVHGMPLDEQIQRQISATDPTSRAIHSQRLEGEAKRFFRAKHLPRRRW